MAEIELYPIFLIDQMKNTVEKIVNTQWNF